VKTLHLYLTRQVLAALVLTVTVFTFVLLVGNVLREVLTLLINGRATIWLVLEAIALLIPYVLAFALPMGMLTATLLVFGRFSADQELTAVRAGGVSLVALVTPVLLLGIVMSCLSGLINLYVAPECRDAYKNLFYRVGRTRPIALIQEGRIIDDFPGYVLQVKKKNGDELEDLTIYEVNDGKVERRSHAARAQVLSVTNENVVRFRLYDVDQQDFADLSARHAEETTISFEFKSAKPSSRKTDLGEMTFLELRDRLNELERLTLQSPAVGQVTPEQLREQMRQLAAMKADLTSVVRVKMHRQLSFSFAAIAFTLIGIPLGVQAHRRETSFGVAVALALVLVYYGFFILAEFLSSRPHLAPHLIYWVPNFIFQAAGAVLLWRANRGV